MSEVAWKQCYNKGCLKEYKEEDDSEGACVHHPGVPVFHDAMKGWSCCKKRSTDFTDFLNIPGCTVGRHNPVKPPETERVKEKPMAVGDEIIVRAPLPREAMKKERPPDDLPMKRLKVTVANSLKSLLTRLKKQEEQRSGKEGGLEVREEKSEEEVKIGTACKNNGCQTLYSGTDVEFTSCRYHPGVPIFHEGYKFWSCCQRRTSDFDEFLRQEGCVTGDHTWTEAVKDDISCRYDWHQTGKHVVISLYAKACLPDQCLFEANQTSIRILIIFNNGANQQLTEFKLYGVIDVDHSSVELLATKAEFKLRKADPISWASLEHVPPQNTQPQGDATQSE